MKNWTLRGAMLAVLLVGTVALGWPTKAKAFIAVMEPTVRQKPQAQAVVAVLMLAGAMEQMVRRTMTRSIARSYKPGLAALR